MRSRDDEKSEAIARATYELVERVGLSGLTMAEVARQACIATGTLYLYFASKEDLIHSLYQKSKLASIPLISAGIDPTQTFRGQSKAMWLNMLNYRLENYAQASFQEQYYNSPWFSEEARELSDRLTRGMADFIASGQKQELIKPLPFAMIAAFILGSVRETARLIRSGAIENSEIMLDAAFRLCWDGIKA